MKRILVYAPDNDPTSFYRAARPWHLIAKKLGPEYEIKYVSSKSGLPLPGTWDQAGFFDLVFLQRPFHPDLITATANFKRMGAKVWIDEDDLQTNVPASHNAFYSYMIEPTQNTIRTCLKMADVVTVTTDYLGEQLKQFTKAKIVTVPNAFDLDTFPKPELNPKGKTILWRGSAPAHLSDLLMVRHELWGTMKDNPDWTLYFLGIYPWWYEELDGCPGVLPNMRYVPHTPTLYEYMALLTQLNPAIWIVPLFDNPFARSRSNLAWLESSWVGAKTVAMGWDEWKKPGIGYNLKEAIGNHGLKNNLDAQRGWDYIQENLLLPKVNEKRLELIRELIG